jgi:hypothetical protein
MLQGRHMLPENRQALAITIDVSFLLQFGIAMHTYKPSEALYSLQVRDSIQSGDNSRCE